MGRTDHADPGLVVLVVEDDFLIREDVAGYLGERGYVVLQAESGESALVQCASEVRVDILFTDINLGGPLTGWDVAEAFRVAHPRLGVIYTSGIAQGRERCVADSLFFDKPCRPGDIINACRQLAGAG
jgi:CheY-like chemotaxis protein